MTDDFLSFFRSFYHEKLEACQSLEDMFVNQAELKKKMLLNCIMGYVVYLEVELF